MFRLYYAPKTCALASHIALEEASAPYEAIRIDFVSDAQRKPEYLAINPKGRVPALQTPEGILTETPAILAFVAQSFPEARLAPTAPFLFARLQAFNSYLCSTVHVAHAHNRRGYRWADDPAALDSMRRKVPETMSACFSLIESGMLEGPWVLGADYTVSDAYLYVLSTWLEGDGVDVSRFPRVIAHRERVAARPAVQRALAMEG